MGLCRLVVLDARVQCALDSLCLRMRYVQVISVGFKPRVSLDNLEEVGLMVTCFVACHSGVRAVPRQAAALFA